MQDISLDFMITILRIKSIIKINLFSKIFFGIAFYSLATSSSYSQCNCVCTGDNLITNFDFSAGDMGFNSSYNSKLPNTQLMPGDYTVNTNANGSNCCWKLVQDHTSGRGNMMLVDGANVPNEVVWSQTVTVKPNTTYIFAMWLSVFWNVNSPQLQFSINGQNFGPIFNPPPRQGSPSTYSTIPPTWEQFSECWYSGQGGTITIEIVNKNIQFAGNDYGIDDITLVECLNSNTLNLTISNDTTICQGDSITLTVTPNIGGGTYDRLPSGDSTQTITVSPNTTTTYTVEYTKNNCGSSASCTVFVHPIPEIFSDFGPKEGCSELCVQFKDSSSIGSGSITSTTWYFSKNDSIAGSNPYKCFVNNSDTVLTLLPSIKVLTNIGCESVYQTFDTLKIYPLPKANFEVSTLPPYRPDVSISFTDKSTGATEWFWNAGSLTSTEQNPTFVFKQETYDVCLTVKNKYRCADSVCKSIEVKSEIIIPNIFTPNEDGENDFFVIKGLRGSGNMLLIFNRWGRKIYESFDYKNNWNGTIINTEKLASDGTYYYIFVTHEKAEYSGYITLLK